MNIILLVGIFIVLFLLIRSLLYYVYSKLPDPVSEAYLPGEIILELSSHAWTLVMTAGIWARQHNNKSDGAQRIDTLTPKYIEFVNLCTSKQKPSLMLIKHKLAEIQNLASHVTDLTNQELNTISKKLLVSREYASWIKSVHSSKKYDFSAIERKIEVLLNEIK